MFPITLCSHFFPRNELVALFPQWWMPRRCLPVGCHLTSWWKGNCQAYLHHQDHNDKSCCKHKQHGHQNQDLWFDCHFHSGVVCNFGCITNIATSFSKFFFSVLMIDPSLFDLTCFGFDFSMDFSSSARLFLKNWRRIFRSANDTKSTWDILFYLTYAIINL